MSAIRNQSGAGQPTHAGSQVHNGTVVNAICVQLDLNLAGLQFHVSPASVMQQFDATFISTQPGMWTMYAAWAGVQRKLALATGQQVGRVGKVGGRGKQWVVGGLADQLGGWGPQGILVVEGGGFRGKPVCGSWGRGRPGEW